MNNKYLVLFITAFLALGFEGIIHADTKGDLVRCLIQGENAQVTLTKKVKDILGSPDSVSLKTQHLQDLKKEATTFEGKISCSDRSFSDWVKAFKEKIDEIIKKSKTVKDPEAYYKSIESRIPYQSSPSTLESLELQFDVSNAGNSQEIQRKLQQAKENLKNWTSQ